MPQVTETEVFRACRTLFGPELQINREFLLYLQPAGVRSAYRKKAKVTHPDRFALSARTTHSKQNRLFQDLNQAHETLQSYLKQRKHCFTARGPYSKPSYSYRRQDPPRRYTQQGTLPARPLQFGLFLYHLGIIPFNAVISAIIWQRQQRPALGEIARRWGWLDDDKVAQIINHRGGASKFGERAEKLGFLSPSQVRTLLFHQRSRQKQMGHYFVSQGYFDEATLNQLLRQLAEHNQTHRKSFGENYYFYHS